MQDPGRGPCEQHVTTLAWEKEKIIAHHLKQQLVAARGITVHQDDDNDRSIDAGSYPDTTLATHLHA
jgi:hypothetical protein